MFGFISLTRRTWTCFQRVLKGCCLKSPEGFSFWACVTWVLINVLLQHLMSWLLPGPSAGHSTLDVTAYGSISPVKGFPQWLFRLRLHVVQRSFCGSCRCNKGPTMLYALACSALKCVAVEITAQMCAAQKPWLLTRECMACLWGLEDHYHAIVWTIWKQFESWKSSMYMAF